MALCPECDTDLDLDEDVLEEGEIITCPECGSISRSSLPSPLSLNPVDEYDEDDDDEPAEEEDEDLGLLKVGVNKPVTRNPRLRRSPALRVTLACIAPVDGAGPLLAAGGQ